MKSIFRDSKLSKVQDVTSFKELTEEELAAQAEAAAAAVEEEKRPPTQDKTARGKQVEAPKPESSSARSPNAGKFTPHCVSLRTGPLPTVSDLLDFWKYRAQLDPSRRFSIIIDDRGFEEVSPEIESSVIDMGLGLGCEYVLIKGIAKPERMNKVFHYASYTQS